MGHARSAEDGLPLDSCLSKILCAAIIGVKRIGERVLRLLASKLCGTGGAERVAENVNGLRTIIELRSEACSPVIGPDRSGLIDSVIDPGVKPVFDPIIDACSIDDWLSVVVGDPRAICAADIGCPMSLRSRGGGCEYDYRRGEEHFAHSERLDLASLEVTMLHSRLLPY